MEYLGQQSIFEQEFLIVGAENNLVENLIKVSLIWYLIVIKLIALELIYVRGFWTLRASRLGAFGLVEL